MNLTAINLSKNDSIIGETSEAPKAIKLADIGLSYGLSYTSDTVFNPVGGEHKGFAYCDSYLLGTSFDFEKKTRLKGLKVVASVIFRSGRNLTKKIGNEFSVNQVYGGETLRFFELYFSQEFEKIGLKIKAGRINPADDFLTSPLYYRFLNNAIDGVPIGILYNLPFATLPNSVWGSYISFKIDPKLFSLQVFTLQTI